MHMTKQRALIKNIVLNSHAHLSAQQIFDLAKEEMPTIAMATVYNNLNALEEAGEIKKMRASGRLDLFDGCLEPHDHLICSRCGQIEDIKVKGVLTFLHSAEQADAEDYELNVYHTCSDCKSSSPLSERGLYFLKERAHNMETKRKLSPPGIAEIVFDSAYLVFVICAGIYMIIKGQGAEPVLMAYGIMAVVLGAGDSFHLVPRIFGHLNGMEHYTKSLGIGKWVTSVTMTVFYLLLYYIWTLLYNKPIWGTVGIVLVILAALRIVLCMCPQNRWTSKDAPMSWAVYRNLPFAVIGILIVCLFWGRGGGFGLMSVAVILSFLFYFPVVLWSQSRPKLGALMLPKTAAYVWIVCMGFSLL